MYYKINDKNEIIATSNVALEDFIESKEGIVNDFTGAKLLFRSQTETAAYKAEKAIYEKQQYLNSIRKRRETECFLIINRGTLWYDTLTVEQITELNDWYTAWLNAPATNVIPEKPQWLN